MIIQKKKNIYIKLGNIINGLYRRILNYECILTKELINEFHDLLIKIVTLKFGNIDFYQYKQYLSDFDFCIIFILEDIDLKINESLGDLDKRFLFLRHYKIIDKYNKTNICSNKKLNKEDINIWTYGTIIRHILIIYDDLEFLNLMKQIKFLFFC